MDVAHVAVFGQTSERGLKLLGGALDGSVFVVVKVGADEEGDGVVHGYAPSVSAMNFLALSMSH